MPDPGPADVQVTVRDEGADGELLEVFELILPYTVDLAGIVALRAARETALHNAALAGRRPRRSCRARDVRPDPMNERRRHADLIAALDRCRLEVYVDDVRFADLREEPPVVRGSAVTFRFLRPPARDPELRLGPPVHPSAGR